MVGHRVRCIHTHPSEQPASCPPQGYAERRKRCYELADLESFGGVYNIAYIRQSLSRTSPLPGTISLQGYRTTTHCYRTDGFAILVSAQPASILLPSKSCTGRQIFLLTSFRLPMGSGQGRRVWRSLGRTGTSRNFQVASWNCTPRRRSCVRSTGMLMRSDGTRTPSNP